PGLAVLRALRAEVTGLAVLAVGPGGAVLGLAALRVVEVELVVLRVPLAVVDLDVHLAVLVGLGHRDLVVALLDRDLVVVDVLDRLPGLGVDRVGLPGIRVDLQRLAGDGVRAVAGLVLRRGRRRRGRRRRRRAAATAAGTAAA